jgi:hypothetical protein
MIGLKRNGSVVILSALVTALSVSPTLADETSMCAVALPDGVVDFHGLVSDEPEAARRATVKELGRELGVNRNRAERMVLECIPPGGVFSDEQVQALWEAYPL